MLLAVGRIGRAHGVRGEVAVNIQTDSPELRFAPGSVLATDPRQRGPLTVVAARWHGGRLLVSFAGVTDRTFASELGGTLLLVDSDELETLTDPNEFHDYQLVGLKAVTVDGQHVGTVTDVLHGSGNETLVIARSQQTGATGQKRDILVPFVAQLVPSVELEQQRIVLDPPAGLFEL